ncbi:MAG: hypothetical protein ACI915_000037 [Gammaproteobacteria bacterium]|jgi:hypothetical protein
MAAFSRVNIAKALSIIGLKKTYIALKKADSLTINRLTTSGSDLALEKIGTVDDVNPKVIGRVGMPDPKLGIQWKNSMTFYGSWFDGLALSDTDYRIRNNILSLSKDKLLDQVQRDDKYGLIGTYYAVFLKMIDLNKGVPIVLLDDSLLSRGSFPVIVPRIPDKEFERELIDGLRISLRKEILDASRIEATGLSVDEVSGDVSDYFPVRNSQ